jgi:hypothetical protein
MNVSLTSSMLYVTHPKYEELDADVSRLSKLPPCALILTSRSHSQQQKLYQNNKELYERTARRGSKALYFGSSGTENETWVYVCDFAYP